MKKKTRCTSLTKRFNFGDIKTWQHRANLETGGNLNLWMENTLNFHAMTQNPKKNENENEK